MLPRSTKLGEGRPAVGGLNAPPALPRLRAEIANLTQLPFGSAPTSFAEMAAHEAGRLSGLLNTLSVSLTKIANDRG